MTDISITTKQNAKVGFDYLTEQQESFCEYLSTGMSEKIVCKKLSISPTQYKDWSKLPLVRERLKYYGALKRQSAMRILTNFADKAAYALYECLDSKNPMVKFQAATKVLELTKTEQMRVDTPVDVFDSEVERILVMRKIQNLTAQETAQQFDARGLEVPKTILNEVEMDIRKGQSGIFELSKEESDELYSLSVNLKESSSKLSADEISILKQTAKSSRDNTRLCPQIMLYDDLNEFDYDF